MCQVGIGIPSAAAALTASDDGVEAATTEWKRRRDFILAEIGDLPAVTPDGGWSLLIDTRAIGMEPAEAARKLFDRGAIAATPMTGWGTAERADRYLRFVFANEPVQRVTGLRERIRTAWGV